MRRIYKPNNVTTSDKYFLLPDIPVSTAAEENDDDMLLDYNDEGQNVAEDKDIETCASSLKKSNEKSHSASRAVPSRHELEQLRDQMIAQATAEATRLIEEGHAKAQAEYQDAIARAAQQIEADRKSACEQGRKQAVEQHSQEISTCIHDIEETIAHIEGTQAGFITGYEQDLKWMALEIAQKILMDTISADETRLVPLVMAAVNSASDAPWMSVEISEHMTKLLTQLQQELKNVSTTSKINIKLIDAPPDTCIIETPDKCFDASITQQIENLKGYFAAEQG